MVQSHIRFHVIAPASSEAIICYTRSALSLKLPPYALLSYINLYFILHVSPRFLIYSWLPRLVVGLEVFDIPHSETSMAWPGPPPTKLLTFPYSD